MRKLPKFYLLALFILSLFFSYNPARAIEYGGVGGRPANPVQDNPRTDSIFVHTIDPGAEVQDAVKVLNNSAETKTLLVYAVDSAPSSGGAFACAQAVDQKTDVGGWIQLQKNEVTLDSLTNEVVPFSINVPADASVGEHNGCIIIQEKTTPKNNGQNGIQLNFRTGLRVAILIPGDIKRSLSLISFSVTKQDGDINLHPKISNSGNVSVDANVSAITSYFFGKQLQNNGGQFPILRGQTSEWNFSVKKPFWGGFFKSRLTVSYDPNPEAVVGKNTGTTLTQLRSKSIWFFSFPTWPALLIELAVLALIIFLIMQGIWVIQRRNAIKNTWIAYVVRPGDEITTLAAEFHVPWKVLAHANHLKPPYTLTPGSIIKTPPPHHKQ